MDPDTATIFTIGHGTRSLDELARALRSFGIDLVVDVRRFPGSRRHPHFGRESLARELPAQEIDYEWWGESLGGRRRSSPQSRHHAWRVEAFRAYADYADGEAFRAALAHLGELAKRRSVAIMCAETLWWRCHRRVISDHLAVRRHDVVHILAPGEAAAHRLHEALRLDEEGHPVYDGGVVPLPDDVRRRH